MVDRAEYMRDYRKRDYVRKKKGSYCLACHLLIHYEDGSYLCAHDHKLKEKLHPACRHRIKGRMRSHAEYYREKLKGGDDVK